MTKIDIGGVYYGKQNVEPQELSREQIDKFERLEKIESKDLTKLTAEEIILLAQSNVNETSKTYNGYESVYQKVIDVMNECQNNLY